jgi:hypothetical protein
VLLVYFWALLFQSLLLYSLQANANLLQTLSSHSKARCVLCSACVAKDGSQVATAANQGKTGGRKGSNGVKSFKQHLR